MDKENQIKLLKKELDDSKYDIYVDTYPMSLIELISLYKDKDIDLKAEYQRVFKWTVEQKTKFIESLFLGLPIPSIFLYQDENALWEVVDGIQRLSTIFEFVGVLRTEVKDEKGDFIKHPALELKGAPKLTSLNGLLYEDLTSDLQREFKKLKLQLIIISKKSSNDVKLEVFRRLNGFGTKLNPQELRNALVLLLNKEYFKFIEELSNMEEYKKCFNLSPKLIKDKKHCEYIVRYLALREESELMNYSTKDNPSIDDFFDDTIAKIVNQNKINIYEEKIKFKKTFELLNELFGDNSFKKYYHDANKHKNSVRESIFEVIIPGLVENIDYYCKEKEALRIKVLDLFKNDSVFEKALVHNPKAIDRMKRLLTISKEYFKINE
ncbi:MAG: DUF262 domain-containing protein [Marinisporobacter sp.]|nr:DUF262 domain-containing protein [Marinisporobacter sp.]